MVLAVVPFVLSWLLKEVPLRTTLERGAPSSTSKRPRPEATPEERLLSAAS